MELTDKELFIAREARTLRGQGINDDRIIAEECERMWQLKQKGKDPKFWAKKNGWRRRQRSRRARRRSRRRLLSGRAAPPRAEVEEAERGKANHRDIRSNSTSPNHWM